MVEVVEGEVVGEPVVEVGLSEEKVDLLRRAYRRPVAGVVLEGIINFERSLEVEEVPPEEEEVFSEPKTYAEYLRYFKAQEEVEEVEEEDVV